MTSEVLRRRVLSTPEWVAGCNHCDLHQPCATAEEMTRAVMLHLCDPMREGWAERLRERGVPTSDRERCL